MLGIPVCQETYCPVCAWRKPANSIISLKKTKGDNCAAFFLFFFLNTLPPRQITDYSSFQNCPQKRITGEF